MNEGQTRSSAERLIAVAVTIIVIAALGGGGWVVWRYMVSDSAAEPAGVPAILGSVSSSTASSRPSQAAVDASSMMLKATLQRPVDGVQSCMRMVSVVCPAAQLQVRDDKDTMMVMFDLKDPAPSAEHAAIKRGAFGAMLDEKARKGLHCSQQFLWQISASDAEFNSLRLIYMRPMGEQPIPKSPDWTPSMLEFYRRWTAADAAGKSQIAVEWISALNKIGQAEAEVASAKNTASWDKLLAELSEQDKAILLGIDQKMSMPAATQSTTQATVVTAWGGAAGAVVNMKAPPWPADGVTTLTSLSVISGKQFVVYSLADPGTDSMTCTANPPPDELLHYQRLYWGINRLDLPGFSLAKDLGITPDQITRLQPLPTLSNFVSPTPEEEKSIKDVCRRYVTGDSDQREKLLPQLMDVVKQAGEQTYPQHAAAERDWFDHLGKILTADQLKQLEEKMNGIVLAN